MPEGRFYYLPELCFIAFICLSNFALGSMLPAFISHLVLSQFLAGLIPLLYSLCQHYHWLSSDHFDACDKVCHQLWTSQFLAALLIPSRGNKLLFSTHLPSQVGTHLFCDALMLCNTHLFFFFIYLYLGVFAIQCIPAAVALLHTQECKHIVKEAPI